MSYTNLDPETFAAETQDARERGFTVLLGHPNWLLLDLDTQDAYDAATDRILELSRLVAITKNPVEWRSKSGEGWHVVVTLDEPIADPAQRIALQMSLGSDPKRGMLEIIRLRNGVDEPSCLFVPAGTVDVPTQPPRAA